LVGHLDLAFVVAVRQSEIVGLDPVYVPSPAIAIANIDAGPLSRGSRRSRIRPHPENEPREEQVLR
jgi:hypothetical protein